MKTLPALKLVYICAYVCIYVGAYTYQLHVNILVIYVCKYFLQMIVPIYICNIITSLNTENVYSVFYCSCSHSYGSIFPRLKHFIRTFKRCFVFKICVLSYHDSISNSVIIGDSSRVFVGYIYFQLRLFTLTYVFPIHYLIYWEDHILAKHQLARIFSFGLVVCRAYRKSSCCQYSHTQFSVIYIRFMQVICQ